MARMVYRCRWCGRDFEAAKVDSPVRGRRILLECGHTASVGQARAELDPPRECSDAERDALFDRLGGGE